MVESYILAVDIGGTRFRVALADSTGTIVKRVSASTRVELPWRQSIDFINVHIKKVIDEVGRENIKGIGAAVAGIVDMENGVIKISPNIQHWKDVPIKKIWQDEFGINVFVCNDASLAALGEYKFGAGKNYRNFAYVTVSTGIGCGLFLDGELFAGANSFAGELGHIIIQPNGPQCGCGGRGCFETLASGTAIARMAREQLQSGKKTIMKQFLEEKNYDIDAEMVSIAAGLKDEIALEIMQTAGRYLGIGLSNLIMIIDPEVIIIGGGVARAGELIIKPAQDFINQKVGNYFGKNIPIIKASLGDDSGIMGAVAAFINHYR